MITYIYQFLYVNLRGPKKKWLLRSILQERGEFNWRVSDFGESAGRQLEYPTNNAPDNGLTVSRKQIQFNKQM